MPLYEYECDAQGHRFEAIRKFSDPPLDKCPQCGGPVHKLFSSPAIAFKGSGFYITDYAKKDSANKPGGSRERDSGGGEKSGEKGAEKSGDKSSDTSGGKSDTKSDAKSDASTKSTPSTAPKASSDSAPKATKD